MGKVAYMFSGQGAQYVGMGKELYDNHKIVKNTLDEVNDILNMNLLNIIFDGPDVELMRTENTQPAILAVSVAFMRLVESLGIKADGAVGLSLGEYGALIASGALKYEDALPLVKKRGRYMQEAVPEGMGTMAAIIGLQRDEVLEVVEESSKFGVVDAVNFNCPGQIAIAGEVAAVEKALAEAKARGASRSVMLNVSAPFHSRMLKSAGERLHKELESISLSKGSIPVIANVDGQYYNFDRNEIIDKLTRQVYSPVMFEDSINKLIEDGYDTFIELGPGRTLCGFVKRIKRDATILNVEDLKSMEKTIGAIGI